MSIEEYLKTLERFVGDPYGAQVRSRFAGMDGRSELAVLQSPSWDEYDQLSRAVAIMTPAEKENAAELNEQQIRRIADDAGADPALLAIFLNGYAIQKIKNQK
jgi:signal recognition particle GTPase